MAKWPEPFRAACSPVSTIKAAAPTWPDASSAIARQRSANAVCASAGNKAIRNVKVTRNLILIEYMKEILLRQPSTRILVGTRTAKDPRLSPLHVVAQHLQYLIFKLVLDEEVEVVFGRLPRRGVAADGLCV